MKIVVYLLCFATCAPGALLAQDSGAGEAGYYSDWFAGKRMANGELVDQDALTASISKYPFDTKLRIHSLDSDKSVVVRVTDRPGPASNELIVVTRAAADQLGFVDQRRARVEIEVLEMGDGRRIEAPESEASARERRWKRGGLAAPGEKPSPFAYSEP